MITGKVQVADMLHITESIAEELRFIVETPSDKLQALSTELNKAPTITPRPEILKIFRDCLGSSIMLSRVVSNLASLNLLRDDPEKTPDLIIEALISGCKTSGNDELAEKISDKKPELITLLSSDTLYMSIKASQLFTIDSQHLHEVKIICDARPIFGPNRDDFPAAILYSILHITASDASENEERFSVALRANELDEIIEECERAKRKLASLQKDLSGLEGKKIFKYGEIE
jgi:hypothetical protein